MTLLLDSKGPSPDLAPLTGSPGLPRTPASLLPPMHGLSQ